MTDGGRVRWLSVKTKLPAAMVLASAVPVALVGLLAYSTSRGVLREGILNANQVTAVNAALVIQERVAQARAVVEEAAIRPGLERAVAAGDRTFVTRLFTNLARTHEDFRSFVVLGRAGRVLAVGPDDPAVVGQDFSRREYFARATDAQRPYVSELLMDDTGHPTIAVSAPMFGAQGERVAVVVGFLSLARLQRLMRAAAEAISGAGYVVDQHGVLVAHSHQSVVARDASFGRLPHVGEALAGRSGAADIPATPGEHRLAGYAPVAGVGWAVVMGRPRHEAYAPVVSLGRKLLVIAGATLAATLVFSVGFGVRMTRPLEQLVGAARRFGDGDLSASVSIRRHDELGEVGRAFNTMARRVAALTLNLDAAVEDRTRQLARERQHLQAIVAAIADGVCVTDTAGRIAMWNQAAERITGVAAAAMVGGTYPAGLRVAVSDEPVTDFSQTIMRRVVDTGEPATRRDVHVTRADGARVPVVATAAPIRDDTGAIVGCVAVFRDVTQETEVSRMKSEFVSTVSHELRTPLTSIRAYAETLKDMVGEDQTVQDFLAVIEEESLRLTRLINQLLNLSRIESGRVHFKQEPVALTPLISRAIQTAQPKARANDVRIGAEIAPDLPPFRGDVDAIEQVLINLVDNAVKYNRRGGLVHVRASVNGGVAVEIRDTGIGMPESALRHLGERFFRVDSSETRRIGGTGLGITLVKEILAAHGARLDVESEPGVGSVFRFVLPRAGAPA